jgi:hypothetical protein
MVRRTASHRGGCASQPIGLWSNFMFAFIHNNEPNDEWKPSTESWRTASLLGYFIDSGAVHRCFRSQMGMTGRSPFNQRSCHA